MSHATDMADDLWDDMTPDALRDRATASEAEAAASWERSDTDGFVSQWAHGITADRDRAQAELIEAGGTARFLALFTTEGEHVPARRIESTRYGWAPRWRTATGTFLPYHPVRRQTLASKGYVEGYVLRPARAEITGSGRGLSGAASCRVEIVPTDDPYRDAPAAILTTDRWEVPA